MRHWSSTQQQETTMDTPRYNTALIQITRNGTEIVMIDEVRYKSLTEASAARNSILRSYETTPGVEILRPNPDVRGITRSFDLGNGFTVDVVLRTVVSSIRQQVEY